MPATTALRSDVTTSDYRPVGCDLHSELELLAMQREAVLVEWVDPDQGQVESRGVVIDIEIVDRAECLVLDVGDQRLRIRLDRLRGVFRGSQAVFRRQYFVVATDVL